MKLKSILSSTILLLALLGASAQTPDFRNLIWGSSVQLVKETEKCILTSEREGRLIYNCPFADSEGKVVYTFTGTNNLMRAKYFLTPDYFNTIFYIRDYRLFQELLTKKYGEPTRVTPKVINKQGIKEDEWAAYLSSGELFVESKWETPRTEIHLTLSKVGDYPAIQIDYISLEYSKLDLEEKGKRIFEKL